MEKFNITKYVSGMKKRIEKKEKDKRHASRANTSQVPQQNKDKVSDSVVDTYLRWKGWR